MVCPEAFAASTRWGSLSVAIIFAAPESFASWMMSKPIGPQPNTPTVIPGFEMCQINRMDRHTQRLQHCAIFKGQESGRGTGIAHPMPCTRAARHRCLPCPAKQTCGHKLGCPCSAELALSAGDRRVNRHALTIFQSRLQTHAPTQADVPSSASPIPPSENQCKSEPQTPTALTRINFSPCDGTGQAHHAV